MSPRADLPTIARPAVRMRAWWLTAGLACLALIGGCTRADWPWADVDTRPQAGMPESTLRPAAAAAGAVELGDDLYMVPTGRDGGGCETWSMQSQSKATLQAVFFRDAEGDFTTDRGRACSG